MHEVNPNDDYFLIKVESFVVMGEVMVSKMPGVYSGDYRKSRVEYNYNFKKLLQYRDCLVFSQKRDGRPLFSKLANADLDGDH